MCLGVTRASGCWIGEDKRGTLRACGLPLLQEQPLGTLVIHKKCFPLTCLLGSQLWSPYMSYKSILQALKLKLLVTIFFLQLYILKFSNIKKS